MLKNFNEKDKKKILSLLSVSAIVMIALVATSGLGTSEDENEVKETIQVSKEDVVKEDQQYELETKLERILSQIQGAGDLDVMITFESSEEIEPAFNTNTTTEKTQEKDQQGGERTITTSSENKTMITSSGNDPIVIKTNQAKINGVIVVASGANDLIVKETLYNAVQTALQIQGHQVEIYSK